MKIGVCIKQVPARDSEVTVSAAGTGIEETENYEASEPDNYALEAGLQIKEKYGGEVVAVLLGPDSASEVVKTALAKGADRALHIVDDADRQLDPLQAAAAICTAVREEQFNLLLSGLQSDDQGFGQTGVLLAELLDLPHASVVVDIQVNDNEVQVKRELEGGWSQGATLPLPAVLTIQSGINNPRYATFKGIIAAKKKEIKALSCADMLPANVAASQEILRIYSPQHSKQTNMLAGSSQEQAVALIDLLKNEVGVL